MLRAIVSPVFAAQGLGIYRGSRPSRRVEVSVLDGEFEVDSFSASLPETLRQALAPTYSHLPSGGLVRLTGVETWSRSFASARGRREVRLASLEAAIEYLGWSGDR